MFQGARLNGLFRHDSALIPVDESRRAAPFLLLILKEHLVKHLSGSFSRIASRKGSLPWLSWTNPHLMPRHFWRAPDWGEESFNWRPKETFFSQGDPADSIFYLQKGRAKVTVVSQAGKEATITLLSAGDFVGEESLAAWSGCVWRRPPL